MSRRRIEASDHRQRRRQPLLHPRVRRRLNRRIPAGRRAQAALPRPRHGRRDAERRAIRGHDPPGLPAAHRHDPLRGQRGRGRERGPGAHRPGGDGGRHQGHGHARGYPARRGLLHPGGDQRRLVRRPNIRRGRRGGRQLAGRLPPQRTEPGHQLRRARRLRLRRDDGRRHRHPHLPRRAASPGHAVLAGPLGDERPQRGAAHHHGGHAAGPGVPVGAVLHRAVHRVHPGLHAHPHRRLQQALRRAGPASGGVARGDGGGPREHGHMR